MSKLRIRHLIVAICLAIITCAMSDDVMSRDISMLLKIIQGFIIPICISIWVIYIMWRRELDK